MVEKVITLENISLLDFLGSENENIRQISAAFPQSKIVSRGNEIRIKGQAPEILKINDILNMLLEHFSRFGQVTPDNVKEYIALEGNPPGQSEKRTTSYSMETRAWWYVLNLLIRKNW